MDYAALVRTRERAGELALSGHFTNVEEIAAQLEWEGRPYIKHAIRI